ncbi:MAG: hypothetical protein RJQ04_21335 [Longimicrobiales bacterium]
MDARERDLDAVARMTPEAKLRVVSAMIQEAWTLKEAWLRLRDPDAPASEIRRRARSMVGEPGS